jgi:hypothetical protein
MYPMFPKCLLLKYLMNHQYLKYQMYLKNHLLLKYLSYLKCRISRMYLMSR